MYIRKVRFVLIVVGCCLVLASGTFSRTSNALARPYFQTNNTLAIEPADPKFINYGGVPAYDSGWEELNVRPDPIAVEFTHNLGGDPDNYLVSLECRDDTSLGTYDCTDSAFNVNASWYGLTDTKIQVYVIGGSRPDGVRVRIYTETPTYDSSWEEFNIRPDPIAVEFTHNLGGDPDDYIVSLECRDDTSLGTYDCTDSAFNINANWYGLTDTVVQAYVVGGSRPDGVRVRIYTKTPAYDSGWEELSIRPDPIAVEFTHNLGGDPDDYLVSLECGDDTSLGTYECANSAFNLDASWYGLTDIKIQAYVVGGTRPDYVRVRIWRTYQNYLPFVSKNYRVP